MEVEKEVKEFYEEMPFPNENSENYNFQKHDWIFKSLPSIPIQCNFLDIGCGTGEMSCFLSHYGNVTATDFSNSSIELAKKFAKKHKIKNIKFLQDDITKTKLKGKYDYIFCMGVLHHIPNIKKAFDNIKKLMHENSYAVFCVYNKYGRFLADKRYSRKLNKERHEDFYNHPYQKSYSMKEFRKLLVDNDFEVMGVWRDIPDIVRLLTGKNYMMTFCVRKFDWIEWWCQNEEETY